MLRVLFSTNALDDRVRAILVDSLYTQPASMAIGALGGIATCGVAAYEAQIPALTVATVILSLIALCRIALGFALPLFASSNTKLLESLFEIGAISYALMVGVVAAMCIYLDASPIAQLLTLSNAIAYAVGIAARNAGSPAVAIGQLCFGLLPVVLALALQPGVPHKVLALSIAMLVPAMTSITLTVFKVLRNSISAAETSARLAEKMQILARTDVVTGLLNRAGMNHDLIERVATLQPEQKLALFWLDLDRFKEVNDTLGHQLGDKLLAEIANRLHAVSPEFATVARFGGDEFIICCPLPDHAAIETLAMEIMAEVTRPIRIDEHRLEIATSMGIAALPDDGADIDTLMQGADLALYQSKVNGRKQISFFDPSMTRDLMRRREVESELRLALQREELTIFYQPIIDLETGRIRAFEALVRWFHPEKGELRPDEFIPVAEESGAIITLGNWITLQAARAATAWPDDVTIAVNLSPVQIKAPGAALAILSALREAKLDPSRLELEITETVLLDHSPNTENFIAELGRAGVRFALDDFGTGYSSLGYLHKYPFSKIKVDRSFVSGLNAGKKSDAIIRAVSGMAKTMGMEIVAEGLETIDQVSAVRDAGCTLGQGYYFSRAVPDYLAIMLLAKESESRVTVQRKAG